MAHRSKLWLAFVLQLVIIFTVVFSGCGLTASADSTTAPAKQPIVDAAAEGLQLRKGIQTILVMGVDDYKRPENTRGYVNDMQCDFLLLVIVDEANQKIQALHINRDTMTEITRLGVFGDAAGKYTAQIALAHAFGSGGSDSCLNAVRAVSNLLGGIKIDHYMSFTMDSVGKVNDMVGGITVRIEDDFTEYDPDLVMGEEITLVGDQALHFVRGRRTVADGTNINRMNRQRIFMTQLYEKIFESVKKDPDFIKKLTLTLSDSFMTDCSIYQLDALSKTMETCAIEPFYTIDGTNVRGEFMEYYLDETSLQNVVRTLFYEPIPQE